jgi:hypothetical protein
MSEETLTAPKKTKRAPKKKATAAAEAAPFRSTLPKNTPRPDVDDLEREIRETELELARVNLEKARAEIDEFKEKKLTKKQKAERAQAAIRAEANAQKSIQDGCAHRLGGLGLEDTYNGDRESALAVMDMPAANAKYALCVRCHKEWRTPDPSLKRSDPEKYSEQLADWKDCLQLLRQAKIKPMAGPGFMFTDGEGRAIHPPAA